MSKKDLKRGRIAEKWYEIAHPGAEKIPDRHGGADFRECDMIRGQVETETKVGGSRLTKLQKERRDQMGEQYDVVRFPSHEAHDIDPDKIKDNIVDRNRFKSKGKK